MFALNVCPSLPPSPPFPGPSLLSPRQKREQIGPALEQSQKGGIKPGSPVDPKAGQSPGDGKPGDFAGPPGLGGAGA